MRGKSIIRFVGPVIVSALAISGACKTTAYGQQRETPQQPQVFSAAYLKADVACKALWAVHAFDPLRDKVPLGGQKPTLAMLTNRTRLLAKDKSLADLAIKTLGKCRAMYAEATVLLPQQTQLRIQGFDRAQDSLIARLYAGKVTFGDYNLGMNRIAEEMLSAMYGVPPDVAQAKAPSVPQQAQTTQPKSPQTRFALVIGNSKYTDLPKLTNPTNDARATVDALRDLGFDVTLVMDTSEVNLRRAVRRFADQSSQADLTLVYYAGHGAQVNGENYLLPVDMEIPHTEADIELSSLKVDDLINSVRSTTKILFLDACRDNPALFKNLVKGRGTGTTGLAPANASHLTRMKPGGGVFIAYATDAGSVALEGDGEHSPFTQALLRNLKKPISIDDMFSLVTREVSLVTKGMQRPYKYASLENIVCLTGSCSASASMPAADIVQEARRSESDEMQIALQTKDTNALEAYLNRYPESSERQKVVTEIARLRRSEFNDWTLFEMGNKRIPMYFRMSSIEQFGTRIKFEMRGLADPTIPLIGTTTFPDGTFNEEIAVYDCKESISAISERKAVSPSGQTLGAFKWADPQILNLSIGSAIVPGTVAATAKNLLCDETMRTPTVRRTDLASMNFRHVASLPSGGEMYYRPLPNEGGSQTQKEAIVLYRLNEDKELARPCGRI
jgi:hypothetical protein